MNKRGFNFTASLFGCDSLWLEVQGALFLTLTGLWYLMPYSTFTTSPVYTLLAKIVPENIWGSVFLGLGISYIAAILLWKPIIRRVAAFFASLLLMFFSVLFFIGSNAGMGFIAFFSLSLGQTIVMLNQHRSGV